MNKINSFILLKLFNLINKISNKKRSFTLAEVLITLAVIGVIASMTVPSMISDTSDKQNKVAWQKAYAELSQVAQQLKTENGGTLAGGTLGILDHAGHEDVRDAFLSHMSYKKKCAELGEPTYTECWHSSIKKFSGQEEDQHLHSFLSYAQLNDGKLVQFTKNGTNCTGQYACGRIMIDINGWKGPNTFGKDIFGVRIWKDKLQPLGPLTPSEADVDDNGCNSDDSDTTGYHCSSEYLIK